MCVEHSQRLHVSKDTFYRSLKAMSRFGLLFYVLIPCPIVSFQCLLCSSLCLFPFLLVACLSPSVCLSARLLCPLPSPLTSPVPRLVTCVSVYIVFVFPCTPCQFVLCDVPLEFLVFPPVSPVSWWYVLDF